MNTGGGINKGSTGGVLLVGAAGGLDWDAGQSGGPAEQVGAVWSLLDELWCSLKESTRHTRSYYSVTELSYISVQEVEKR